MSEWRETTLGEIAILNYGKALKVEDRESGEVAVYSSAGITGWHNKPIVKGKGIIVGRKGTVGSVYYADMPFYCIDTAYYIKKDDNKYDLKFLYYYLKYLRLDRLNEDSAVPGLNRDNAYLQDIYLPEDISEQKRISRILSVLDDKIDFLRRQNETLEAIAQTLFNRWFVEFEFPDENGLPYKSSGGKMVSSELGKIPKGWNISKVVKEIQIVGGGTPSTKEPSYWENGTINWYTPSDLTSNNELYSSGSGRKITEKGLSNSSATLFPEYSLLMTSRATIGEIAINTNKACTNQGFIILIPNNSYPVYFLHGWLLEQLNIIRRLASGSTFPEINRSEFKNFDILKIPIETMNVYKKIVTPIYRKIENNIRESKSLKITRDTLLPKLMSGQIRVK